jgi:Mg2+ and Co2+ transporter CorA
MGLPTTLAGISGFLIFVVLILAISASDLYPDRTAGIRQNQAQFSTYLNATTNQTVSQGTDAWSAITNVFNFITGVFGMIIVFISLEMQYALFFVGIAVILPPEFYVLFALVGSSIIISIIKLLFLAGD